MIIVRSGFHDDAETCHAETCYNKIVDWCDSILRGKYIDIDCHEELSISCVLDSSKNVTPMFTLHGWGVEWEPTDSKFTVPDSLKKMVADCLLKLAADIEKEGCGPF